jgi:thiol-disulfide isomerase/thioredoxin/anti-sigma factor RsiW
MSELGKVPQDYAQDEHDAGRLRAYIDGELSAEEMSGVQAHLAACGRCNRRADELRRIAVEVSALLALPAPTPHIRTALARFQGMLAEGEAARLAPMPNRAMPQAASKSLPMHGAPAIPGPAPRSGWATGGSRMAASIAVGLLLAATLVALLAAQGPGAVLPGTAQEGQSGIESFAPTGTVRHLVISNTTVANRPEQQWIVTGQRTEEAWYTPGKTHLLMKNAINGWPENQGKDDTLIYVTDDSVYRYERWDNSARKYPFNPYYLQTWGPTPGGLEAFMAQWPGYEVVEHATLQSRPVVKLARLPRSDATPTLGDPGSDFIYEVYAWFDLESARPLQYEYVSRYTRSDMNGLVITTTSTLIQDEALERRNFPDNFFTFEMPPGAKLIEERDPFAPDVVASKGETPEPAPGMPAEPESAAQMVGKAAPDFTFDDVQTGKPVTLSSFRGKPVVLNFWGTWCPPCVEGILPAIQQLKDEYEGQVEIVSVSSGPRDGAVSVAAFISQEGYNWTFLHAPNIDAIPYTVDAIPATYFIDSEGTIRAALVGGGTLDTLKSKLATVLHDQPAP